ncbi:hypothetical protein HZ989_14725 [Brevundimonas sp. AJA228-03]|jgi:hypothetical protein|uniref:hypothetical protein n=1 Tax=Brevundimonas sp. AJA228-03 TaxID=2752515 RepID=UPI001AE03C79|nr:hypothetical protein [Brevundimonas sp. AJA228-03]QTN19444.1 hypothetical protein HZ989_14725 [Brevundimonas sp. AJA228-03]
MATSDNKASADVTMTSSAVIVTFLLLAMLVGGGLVGCPYYNVWKQKMAGQAELQYQQGARQALIAQAAAEDEASIKRAEAATRRVRGWADAAKRGCEDVGLANDRACINQLLRDAATYSIAKEGHEGVIVSVGAPVSVAVQPQTGGRQE